MSKIVVLDRDGVINHDSSQYIKSPDEWRPICGSLEAIAYLHRAGFTIVVATNQSGVGRNLFTYSTLEAIHEKMTSQLRAKGGYLSGIFYCPHLPDDGCDCRKPRTGLLRQISEFLKSDLQGAPFVGDSLSDIQAAEAYGCRPILVKSGNGQRSISRLVKPYPEIYADLAAAARAIVSEMSGDLHV